MPNPNNHRTDRIQVPVNAREKKEYYKLAETRRMTISELVRQLLHRELTSKQEAA